MSAEKYYSGLTIEELLAEEKSLRKNELFSAGAIGILVGIMTYGLVKNGFGSLYLAIPIFLIVGIFRNFQVQKQHLGRIRQEINLRK